MLLSYGVVGAPLYYTPLQVGELGQTIIHNREKPKCVASIVGAEKNFFGGGLVTFELISERPNQVRHGLFAGDFENKSFQGVIGFSREGQREGIELGIWVGGKWVSLITERVPSSFSWRRHPILNTRLTLQRFLCKQSSLSFQSLSSFLLTELATMNNRVSFRYSLESVDKAFAKTVDFNSPSVEVLRNQFHRFSQKQSIPFVLSVQLNCPIEGFCLKPKIPVARVTVLKMNPALDALWKENGERVFAQEFLDRLPFNLAYGYHRPLGSGRVRALESKTNPFRPELFPQALDWMGYWFDRYKNSRINE